MDDNRINITVCGDGGTGKSSITLRLVKHEWNSDYDPTIEDSYSVSRTVDSQQYSIHITDTAGQEEYRSMFDSASLADTDAVLLVYDITSRPTLGALDYFLDLIHMETEKRVDRGGVAPIKMVAGNKCDLGKVQGMRQISAKDGLEWARERGCLFMETSARDMIHVEETFELIVRRVVAARNAHTSSPQALGGAQAYSGNRTQPISPMDEKDDPYASHQQQPSGFKKFLMKFGCFR